MADKKFNWGKVHASLVREGLEVDQPLNPLSGMKVALPVAHALFEEAQHTGKLTFREIDVQRHAEPFWGAQEPDVDLVVALIRSFDCIIGNSRTDDYSFRDEWPAVRSELREAARSMAHSADRIRLSSLASKHSDRQMVEIDGATVDDLEHGRALLEDHQND